MQRLPERHCCTHDLLLTKIVGHTFHRETSMNQTANRLANCLSLLTGPFYFEQLACDKLAVRSQCEHHMKKKIIFKTLESFYSKNFL